MSILNKHWQLKYQRPQGESLWTSLLNARHIENPGHFFATAQLEDLHDPFLFPDMQKAVERLQKAIHARERIVVYGDYDVDGTSGAALLIHTLRFLGAEVSYRIPHRMKDGYGLHAHYVEALAKQQVKVLITVDCGISCPKEVALAQTLGIDTIITDHHSIPKNLPQAYALLHPQLAPSYPFKHLAGSGVAFKLACGLLIATQNQDMIPILTDLASLGTVADCVPLVGENRAIVKLGLEQMQQTKWDGLRAILQRAGSWNKPFTADTIGFQIGPRINASGRMDNPLWALQALLATGEEAHQKSEKLDQLNHERRQLTEDIFQEAEAAINTQDPVIIAAGDWSSGVVGIIAGRLQEKYGKPTFIAQDRGDHLVGSARSLPGFHAVHALDAAADFIENYGGHEQAAGFHLKKEHYPAFKEKLLNYAKAQFAENPLQSSLQIDFKLEPQEINLEHCEKINSFAPFGVGNAAPLFQLDEVKIINARPVGQEEKHLKFTAKAGGELIDGIGFYWGEHQEALFQSKSLLIHLEKNEWKDRCTPQLRLVDAA